MRLDVYLLNVRFMLDTARTPNYGTVLPRCGQLLARRRWGKHTSRGKSKAALTQRQKRLKEGRVRLPVKASGRCPRVLSLRHDHGDEAGHRI